MFQCCCEGRRVRKGDWKFVHAMIFPNRQARRAGGGRAWRGGESEHACAVVYIHVVGVLEEMLLA